MDFDPWIARCADCDYEEQMPSQEHAEHATRVHEDQTGHDAFAEPDDDADKST